MQRVPWLSMDQEEKICAESDTKRGPVAQLGAHLLCTQGVVGSSPIRSTILSLFFSRKNKFMLERAVQKTNSKNKFPHVLTLPGETPRPNVLANYGQDEIDSFYQEIEDARVSLNHLAENAPQNFSLILWSSAEDQKDEVGLTLEKNHKTNLLVIPSTDDFFSWEKFPTFCSELSQLCGSISFSCTRPFLESFLYPNSLANALCKNRNIVLRNHMFSPGKWLVWQNFTFVNFQNKLGWNTCHQSCVEGQKDKDFNSKYNSEFHLATFASKEEALATCINAQTTLIDALPDLIGKKQEVHLFLPVYVIKDLSCEDAAEVWSPQAIYIDDTDKFRLAMGKSDDLAPLQVALDA